MDLEFPCDLNLGECLKKFLIVDSKAFYFEVGDNIQIPPDVFWKHFLKLKKIFFLFLQLSFINTEIPGVSLLHCLILLAFYCHGP